MGLPFHRQFLPGFLQPARIFVEAYPGQDLQGIFPGFLPQMLSQVFYFICLHNRNQQITLFRTTQQLFPAAGMRFLQNMIKNRMKRTKIDGTDGWCHGLEAALHGECRFLRKGNHQDLPRRNPLFHQIQDTVCDSEGLAGAGTSQEQQRPRPVGHSFPLCLVHSL